MKSMLGHSLALVILGCIFELAASQECKESSTTDEFVFYVRKFPACRADMDMTTFQNEIQIINQVIDFDGQFNKDGFQRNTLTEYCSNVQSCTSQVSACESKLNDFVENAGTALCQNGVPMFKDIDNALNTIANNPCDLFAPPEGLPNDGCQLSGDNAAPKSYLQEVKRARKKSAAISRCMSRYSEVQRHCSPDVIAALATLTAASVELQNIGPSFKAYSSYAKPSMGNGMMTLSVRGFMHFYVNGAKEKSCTDLGASSVLLWNTYIRVDGTGTELRPMTGRTLLTNVIIQFSDDAGRVLDNYMASSFNGMLSKQTSRQQSGDATDILVEDIDDNLVVLTHPGVNTRIAVSMQERGLSVVVSIPSSLIKLETLGVMVEGCDVYGATVIDNIESAVSGDCRSNCTASSSNVDEIYYDECSYDCTHGAKAFTSTYSDIDEVLEAVAPDVNGAVHHAVSTLLYTLLITSLYLLS